MWQTIYHKGKEMKITRDWLKEHNACAEVLEWFDEHYPDGCELQDLLNELAATKKYDYWCIWLLRWVGKVDTEIRIEGNLECDHSFYTAGNLVVTGDIKVNGCLYSGGIDAGGGIEAGNIKSLGHIKAGWSIEAGRGGIKAGLTRAKSPSADKLLCICPKKPKNLKRGIWKKRNLMGNKKQAIK